MPSVPNRLNAQCPPWFSSAQNICFIADRTGLGTAAYEKERELAWGYLIQPSSLALSLARDQALATNSAWDIGDRRSTCSGKFLP